ncbi:transposase [Bifidobacterium sp. DSM 109957]|uniref:Transposase n=2 Tax=Bifidobacterium oedipodis TaxID=2675322 RepID=A0A7Y0EN19_9BIFI|nr:transposase [Bifidobacterium sp. DSM 109957]
MHPGRRMFTPEEAAYLSMLPAVKHVSSTRISYTHEFKVTCLADYLSGHSPSAFFRQSGLEPSLIGSKRIERCVARWKQDDRLVKEARLAMDKGVSSLFDGKVDVVEPDDVTQSVMSLSRDKRYDLRDLIIYQQSLHIHELEQEVARLRAATAPKP